MTRRSLMGFIALLMLASAEARAALLVEYNFTGLTGTTPNGVPPIPNPLPLGIAAANLVRGFNGVSAVTPIVANDAFDSVNWAGSSRVANQDYSFTITPGSTPLNLASLEYTDRRSDDGPRNFEVDYSLGGSSVLNTLMTYSLQDALNHRETILLSGIAGLQNLTQSVTFFIFGFNADNNSGAYRLGNFTTPAGIVLYPNNLILTTADAPRAVPEPSTVAMAGMGGVVLAGYGWRRRTRLADRSSS